MRAIGIGGLIVLMSIMLMACPGGGGGGGNGDGNEVAAGYRGMYVSSSGNVAWEIKNNEAIAYHNFGTSGQAISYQFPAWTEGNELWVTGSNAEFITQGQTLINGDFILGHFDATSLSEILCK